MTLGSYLHVLKVPFAGVILSAIGITIALVGARFLETRVAVFWIGIVTALLKMLSLGGVVLNPMIGILAESVLATLVLLLVGRDRRWKLTAAGAAAVFWNIIHPFFTQGILAGAGMLTIYQRTVSKGAALLGLNETAVFAVLAGLILIHLGAGAVAGVVAWEVGRAAAARLRGLPTSQ
ncbi:MAG TPA: hypothetical protein EYH31_06295 [Anaerolineae bacterium]|nr:hypothetical protein [Anaerolineae bacterium]